MAEKNCSAQCSCQYKQTDATVPELCTYSGYCELQIPKEPQREICDLRFDCTCGTSAVCKFHTGQKI